MEKVTIADIRKMDTDFITASVAGQAIGVDPQSLRVQAWTDAKKLGFPVIVVGKRMMIPRKPFLRFIDEGV